MAPCRLVILTLALCACGAHAQDPPGGRPFKFTAGEYFLSGGGQAADRGLDLNLRNTSAFGNAWIGWYGERESGFRQWRTGWDRSFDLAAVRVQPSVQLASGGFRGGSLSVETGEDWFVGAGLGRTNLRPYANLNFDPNDSVTVQAGRRWGEGDALMLQLIADNREHPDQRHLHLNWRSTRSGHERLTLDLLAKRGTLDDGQRIQRLGVSATYDWPRWFVRAAWDPKVNFTPQDMLRLSAGARF